MQKRLHYLLLLFLFGSNLLAQQVEISGVITDATDNSTLPGVNVIVVGTETGTMTDIDGNYTIIADIGQKVEFSFIGMRTEAIAVTKGKTTINLAMKPDVAQLEDIVVVGYGVQKKSDLTGSVSSIKSDDISKLPVAAATEALAGKVSGVQITQQSGAPGSTATVRIRGVGTTGDSNPLYVVDGMLLDDISFISPNDIESMEVLKDASATAIYGSRAANGVVMISTKQGKKGKTSYNFNSYYGFQKVVHPVKLTNATEYQMLVNELSGGGTPPTYGTANTNWQDEVFRVAPIQDYNVSVNGATEKTTYNISLDYFNQDGVIENSTYDRLTLRFNNTYKLGKHVKFGNNISLINWHSNGVAGRVVTDALNADPTVAPKDSNGKFSEVNNGAANPAAVLFYESNNPASGFRTVGNIYLDITFLKDFVFKTSFGGDFSMNSSKSYTPEFLVSPTQQNITSVLNVGQDRFFTWLWENTVTYTKRWENSSLSVLGGITSQRFQTESLGGSRTNVPNSEELWYLDIGSKESATNYNNAGAWSMLSYLGRVNYSLQDKYLLTASIRADGSSRFGSENRFGYFPSFALGWKMHKEDFMQNIDWLSHLKLRGSWGQIGNDKIGYYPSYSLIQNNLNAVFGTGDGVSLHDGGTATKPENPNIKWERTEQVDLGINTGVLNDKLTFEFDYFRKTTNDMLVDIPIVASAGYQQFQTKNIGTILNQGLEFSATWKSSINEFNYSIGFNGTTIKNEVLSLGGEGIDIYGGSANGSISKTAEGHPIGAFYGYVTDGVFQTLDEIYAYPHFAGTEPGDIRFRDLNGDNVIDENDRDFIGSPIPDFMGGMYFNFDYKGFDFNLDWQFQVGNEIYNAKKAVRPGNYNFEVSFLDRWTGEGTSNSEPRLTNGGNNYLVSDRFIESADYMRLRNIQFGYSISEDIVSKWGISKLRFYLSATNIWTITSFTGYSPEINSSTPIAANIDTGGYPVPATYNLGVNLTF